MSKETKVYPIKIEFCDWHMTSIPDIMNKVIIDLLDSELTAKKHITNANKVNIKTYEISEEITENISALLDYNQLKAYLELSDNDKTDNGYRDGWYTAFCVYYNNKESYTGEMGTIWKESPLEKIIFILRKNYPYIEILNKI